MRLADLAVDQIDPPRHAHRTELDEPAMLELMADIAANGLEQPIKVRPSGERYEIIFGHRRYEAHRRLGRLTIAAFIDGKADDTDAERSRFAENFHRTDLTPMEEAAALERFMRECGVTLENAARMMHRSLAWISGRLQLLTLYPDLQDALHARAISTGAALALADVDDEAHRRYLLEHAQRNGASIAVVRAWVGDYAQQKATAGGGAIPPPDPSKPPAAAVVLLPCFACAVATDHTAMVHVRLCTACHKELSK